MQSLHVIKLIAFFFFAEKLFWEIKRFYFSIIKELKKPVYLHLFTLKYENRKSQINGNHSYVSSSSNFFRSDGTGFSHVDFDWFKLIAHAAPRVGDIYSNDHGHGGRAYRADILHTLLSLRSTGRLLEVEERKYRNGHICIRETFLVSLMLTFLID